MTFEELLEKHGKYCPNCGSGQVTTTNNRRPLRHRCLDCGHKFVDSKAIIGKEAADKVKQSKESFFSKWEKVIKKIPL
jgi:transposase-like protein